MLQRKGAKAPGPSRSRFISFAEKIARLDINPVHRTDFLEELKEISVKERGENGLLQDVLNVHVSEDKIEIMKPGIMTAEKFNENKNQEKFLIQRGVYTTLQSTYFETALKYWKARNMAQDFSTCFGRLFPLSRSLPLLIHSLPEVIEILMEVVSSSKSLAREPAYHLLGILARDVQNEFAPYLCRILNELIKILDIQDLKSIELTFYTLASLFRFLFRLILRDLPEYLELYIPWLTHKTRTVRLFAAESLSFLLRKEKTENLTESLEHVYAMISSPEKQESEDYDAISDVTGSNEDEEENTDSDDCPDKVRSSFQQEDTNDQTYDAEITADGSETAGSGDDDNNDCEDDENDHFSQRETRISIDADKRNRLAESIGCLLFEVVKNVQNSFTGKLLVVIDSVLSHLCKRQVSELFANITCRALFQCLRNHTTAFGAKSCQDVEDILIEFLELRCCEACDIIESGNVEDVNRVESIRENEERCEVVDSRLTGLFSIVQLFLEWVSLRPRPKGRPVNILRKAAPCLSKLLKSVENALKCQQQYSKEFSGTIIFPVWKLLIQSVIKLWASDPEVTFDVLLQEHDILNGIFRCTFECSKDVVLAQPVANVEPLLTGGLHLARALSDQKFKRYIDRTLIEFLVNYLLCLLDHDGPYSLNEEMKCISITLLCNVADMCETGVVGSKDRWKKILQQQIHQLKETADANISKGDPKDLTKKKRKTLASTAMLSKSWFCSETSVSSLFTSLRLIKTIISVENRTEKGILLSANFATTDMHNTFGKLVATLSSEVFRALSFLGVKLGITDSAEHSNGLASQAKQLTSLLLLLKEVMIILFASPEPIHISQLGALEEFTKRDINLTSPNEALFSILLMTWEQLLLSCRPSGAVLAKLSEDDFRTVSNECLKWVGIFTSALLQIVSRVNVNSIFDLSKNPGCQSANQLMRCVLLVMGHPHIETRHCIAKFLSRLPPRLISTLLMSKPSFTGHSLQNDSISSINFIDELSEDEQNRAQLFIETIMHLEELEDTLENERCKIRLISEIPAIIFEHGAQRITTWMSLIGTRVLLSQLRQKFMPLWEPTIEAVTQIIYTISDASSIVSASMCCETLISENQVEVLTSVVPDSSQTIKSVKRHSEVTDVSTSNSKDGVEANEKSPNRRKRRRLEASSISLLHCWLFNELQQEVYSSCQYAESDSPCRTTVKQSNKYKKMKGRVKERFHKILSGDSAQFDEHQGPTNYFDFWKLVSLDDCNAYKTASTGNTIRQTDCVTRHHTHLKVLSKLTSLCAPNVSQLMSDQIPTALSKTDSFAMRQWLKWTLQWALAAATALCGEDVIKFDGIMAKDFSEDIVSMHLLLSREKKGKLARMLDVLRAVLTFGHIGKSGLKRSEISSIWLELLERCTYRLMLLPDCNLQNLCLQVSLKSHWAPDLDAYRGHLQTIIGDVGLTEHLMGFSIDKEEGLIRKEHRPIVIPFLIRILFSKLSKKAKNGSGSSTRIHTRRKAIFQFFSRLPSQEIPILLSILFRSVMDLHSITENFTENLPITSESQREKILLSFFQSLENCTSSDEIFEKWTIERRKTKSTSLQLVLASWTHDKTYKMELPLVKLSQRPLCLVALLASLELVCIHMRQNIGQYVVFFGQLFVSIIAQFHPVLELHTKGKLEELESINPQKTEVPYIGRVRVRKAVKDSVQLFGKIISNYPQMCETWNLCLLPSKDIFIDLLAQGLKGGGSSAILRFVCQMAYEPLLFKLFKGALLQTIPIMFDALKFPVVLNSMLVREQRKKMPKTEKESVVDLILTFVLRLCRGGFLDICQASKEARDRRQAATSMLNVRKTKLKRRRNRCDSNSGSESSGDMALEQEKNEHINLEAWKKELECDCAAGREVLKPHLGELLRSLKVLISYRRSNIMKKDDNVKQPQQSTRVTNKRPPSFVMIRELELLTDLARYMAQDLPTSCELIELLLLSLPKRGGRSGPTDEACYRMRMILLSVRELLTHLGGFRQKVVDQDIILTSERTLELISTILMKQLQIVHDLLSRQELARLLLCVSLTKAGISSPIEKMQMIIEAIPHGDVIHEHSHIIDSWMPYSLKQSWILESISNESLWQITVAIILVALTSLRPKSATAEPDLDLHITIFSELIEASMNYDKPFAKVGLNGSDTTMTPKTSNNISHRDVLIPAQHQHAIIIQTLFMISALGIDPAVRREAGKVLTKAIDRIYKISELRLQLKDRLGPGKDRSDIINQVNLVEAEWSACHILMKDLAHSVMTTVRHSLKSTDSNVVRSALEVLSHIVRVFGRIKEYLPSPTIATSFFDHPINNVNYTIDQQLIETRFCLDLFPLTKFSRSEENRLSGGDVGGDVFVELLHLQRHRRMRGIQLLATGLSSGNITCTTALSVCIPIALKDLLQLESSNSEAHIGMSTQSASCLANAARIIRWSDCLKLVRLIINAIYKNPRRETVLIQAMSKILSSFDYQIEDAAEKFIAAAENVNMNISNTISESVAVEAAIARKEQAKQMKKKKLEESSPENAPLPLSVEAECAESDNSGDLESDEERDNIIIEGHERMAREKKILQNKMIVAQDRIFMIQRSLKVQLLPMLRKLVTAVPKKRENNMTALGSRVPGLESGATQREHSVLVKPQVISLILQIIRHLPTRQFHAQLPKLLSTLAACLTSRDLESRRRARAAFIAVTESLGPHYFAWCVNTLANTLTKGYQVAVLMFTATNALCQLVLGHTSVSQASKQDIRISCGSIDEAIPMLLPLIGQELDRLCDPDRPEYETGGGIGVLTKRAGIDEQRYMRSAEMVHLMCRVASVEVLCNTILRYLYGLLTGQSCESRSLSCNMAIAFSKKYRNIVLQLFEQAIIGVSRNPSCTTFVKLRLSYRLLLLHDKMLNQMGQPKRGKKYSQHPEDSSIISKKGIVSTDLALQEDDFFVQFLTAPDIEVKKTESSKSEQFAEEIEKLHNERLKKYIIQPGAATGKSAEQVLRVSRGVDPSARVGIVGIAGLRLLAAIQKEIRAHPLVAPYIVRGSGNAQYDTEMICSESEDVTSKAMLDLLNACSEHVVDCFCGENDDLFQLASKCLVNLFQFDIDPIYTNGRKIALTILRIFENSAGSSSKVNVEEMRGITSTCTRVLAVLLNRQSSVEWFHSIMTTSDCFPGEQGQIHDGKSNRRKHQAQTFNVALLTQIRFSLHDPHLRFSALQLFRSIILPKREENLKTAEHAALVYQCADETLTLLLQQGANGRLVRICCSVYINFLLNYPMSEKAQGARMLSLIRNLEFESFEGRKAVLSLIHDLICRLAPEVLRQRYAGTLMIALIFRLIHEDDHHTRLMVRVVIARLLALIDSEDARIKIIKICSTSFLVESLGCRAALAEFLGIVVNYYGKSPKLYTDEYFNYIIVPLQKVLELSSSDYDGNSRSTSFPQPNGLPEIPKIPIEDWKLSYLVLRTFERIIAYSKDAQMLFERCTNMSFSYLWRFTLNEGLWHPTSTVSLAAIRVLSQALIKVVECNTDQFNPGDKKKSALSLFSKQIIPELSKLSYKEKKTKEKKILNVSPLVTILTRLVHLSQNESMEKTPELSKPLAQVIPLICHVVLSINGLSDECDDIVEVTNRSEQEFENDDIDLFREEGEDKHIKVDHNSSSMSVEMVDLKPIANEQNDRRIDGLSSLCIEITETEDEEYNDSNEEINNVVEEENEETLYEMDETDSVTLLQDQSVATEDPDITITSSAIVKCPETTDPDIFSALLTKTRISRIISQVAWKLRRNIGNVFPYRVRTCTAVRILEAVTSILPLEKVNCILQTVFEALHLAATLLSKDDVSMDYSDFDLLEINLPGQTPRKNALLIGQLARLSLKKMEDDLRLRGCENAFLNIVKEARVKIGKKRRERRLVAQQIKVKYPQVAAAKKIKKNLKSKQLKKRKLQTHKRNRGDAI